MFSAENVAKDFPILQQKMRGKRFVYLNSAATTQKPIQVINAISDFYSKHNGSVHRGMSEVSARATEMFESAHKKTEGFIGAKEGEVIFTKNTTESLNLAAYSLTSKLQRNDEVLITKMEHHSNFVPWQQLALQRGFKLNFVEVQKNGTLDLNEFEEKISDKTKIVAFNHCSNVLGTINDAKEICKIARDHDCLSVVDGAQSVPHFPVDVKKLGCDFLAFSAHKMLGPTGMGVFYGRKELLEEMTPFIFGGDMISEVFVEKSIWNDLPYKFEAGTPHSSGAAGLSAAIDYLNKLGMDNVFSHENNLLKHAYDGLSELDYVQMYGPTPDKKTGVISFNVKGIHPHDIGGVLDEFGIEIRTGHHCAQPLMKELNILGSARMSFYVYNSKEDIDLALEAIKKTFKLMG